MQQITFFFFFSGMQTQPMETYSASCPNTMENSTSSKQRLKTPGKCFTRSKVKKIGVYRNTPEAFHYWKCPLTRYSLLSRH